jgi:hypothetical protein
MQTTSTVMLTALQQGADATQYKQEREFVSVRTENMFRSHLALRDGTQTQVEVAVRGLRILLVEAVTYFFQRDSTRVMASSSL